jgi:uncharacterized protein (TIGR02687 family)
MDTTQIISALRRLFDEEQWRLVFWNDPESEFASTISDLELDGVTVLCLDDVAALEAKIRIEREDTEGKYLLYSACEEPDPEIDWFLDMRLYSYSFRADRASIILDQLGLSNQHLHEHLTRRRKFFDNKDRLRKLQALIEPEDNEADLDLKMLAVVTRADQPELFNIIRTLYHDMATPDNGDTLFNGGEPVAALENPPKAWDAIEKYDLDESLWRMVKTTFSYEEEIPSLKNFLIRMLVTDFAHHLRADVPSPLVSLLLPKAGWSNAVVCLDQWRDSSSKATSYDHLSTEVARRVKLADNLGAFEVEDLLDMYTFLDVEKAIMSRLRKRVEATAEMIDRDLVQSVVARRQAGHWASLTAAGAAEVPRSALNAVYSAILAAAELFELRQAHAAGFHFDDAASMYKAYNETVFRFDQLYRHFCEHADAAEAEGWNVVKLLREVIEATYSNWFIVSFGVEWGRLIEKGGADSMLSRWRLDGVPSQQKFFNHFVKPTLDKADNRRAFVIISDAFRYEAAEELTRDLNGKYRFEATLSSQLGVLPSYTALGMASLLPHKALEYQENGAVLADGQSTAGIDPRGEVLASVNGIALRADDLIALKKEEGRALVAESRVIYIYHNIVDSAGDSASTENQTFAAVRRAITQLGDLVRYIVNNLNGNFVLITADHGFLFTESSPDQTDKSSLGEKPEGTIIAKKRYLLGRDLGEHPAAWSGSTNVTAGADGDMDFWIPKGSNRFHFAGGAKFIHGGAMPQEIVVPVITVRHRKDKGSRGKTATKYVPVHVLGAGHKITTSRHRFELLQTEPVNDRMKAVTLRVAVYDDDSPVSNIETVTFESSSESIDDRRKWVSLTLQDREFDKRRPYRLVLQEADTGIEHEAVDIVIDRAFTDDF